MILLVASRLYDPMQAALQNLAAVIAMRTNVVRMNEILDHEIQQGGDTLTNKGCDITFDHVGFAYKSGETVLSDVSFTAKQGEVTALVGPSGGGKTTVSRLAVRFWIIKRANYCRRYGYFKNRSRKADDALFYRFSRCNAF